MINNIIDQIKKYEKKAKEIVASSKKEAAEIIEKAYQQANSKIRDAEIKAKKLLLEAEAQAVEDAKTEKKKLEEEYGKKTRNIVKASAAKEEEAIKILIGKVLD